MKIFQKNISSIRAGIYLLVVAAPLLFHKSSFAQSMSEKVLGLPKVSAPSKDTFLEAFGAYENGGKVFFRGKTATGETPEMKNLLVMQQAPVDMRRKLYEQSSCGARQFQLLTVGGKTKGHSYGVVSQCGPCLGLLEVFDNGLVKGVSDPVNLPQGFCDGLWGGIIPIKDPHGL